MARSSDTELLASTSARSRSSRLAAMVIRATATTATSAWRIWTVSVSVAAGMATEPFRLPQTPRVATTNIAVTAPRCPNRRAAHTSSGNSTYGYCQRPPKNTIQPTTPSAASRAPASRVCHGSRTKGRRRAHTRRKGMTIRAPMASPNHQSNQLDP